MPTCMPPGHTNANWPAPGAADNGAVKWTGVVITDCPCPVPISCQGQQHPSPHQAVSIPPPTSPPAVGGQSRAAILEAYTWVWLDPLDVASHSTSSCFSSAWSFLASGQGGQQSPIVSPRRARPAKRSLHLYFRKMLARSLPSHHGPPLQGGGQRGAMWVQEGLEGSPEGRGRYGGQCQQRQHQQ